MRAPSIERREPALMLVLSIITFGIYLPFWYHGIYQDLEALDGRTPTGHGFWLDFFFVTSAIQEDQVNRVVEKMQAGVASGLGAPV